MPSRFTFQPGYISELAGQIANRMQFVVGDQVVKAVQSHTPVGEARKGRKQARRVKVALAYLPAAHMGFGIGEREQARAAMAAKTYGMEGARFIPVEGQRGISAAMSRSIRRGTFTKQPGGLEIHGSSFTAVFPARKHKPGTLRDSIDVLDVRQEGRRVTLEVGSELSYAMPVEIGHRVGKSGHVDGRHYLARSMDELAPKIEDGSLLAIQEG